MARTTDERLDYLMEQLEKGTQNIFESGRYAEYLAVMSKFHHYSFRNTILIFLQNPNASHVAGFHAWKKDFSRSVKAGDLPKAEMDGSRQDRPSYGSAGQGREWKHDAGTHDHYHPSLPRRYRL